MASNCAMEEKKIHLLYYVYHTIYRKYIPRKQMKKISTFYFRLMHLRFMYMRASTTTHVLLYLNKKLLIFLVAHLNTTMSLITMSRDVFNLNKITTNLLRQHFPFKDSCIRLEMLDTPTDKKYVYLRCFT